MGQQKIVLQDLNWGAFDNTYHTPKLSHCNYYIIMCPHFLVHLWFQLYGYRYIQLEPYMHKTVP